MQTLYLTTGPVANPNPTFFQPGFMTPGYYQAEDATSTWDLTLDVNGNIAVASEPYALAQDVASACRTYLGEVYYDTTQGIPYSGQILGQTPPIELLRAQLVAAALTVPDVVSAQVYLTFVGRVIGGQVQFTDSNGTTQTASF